MREHKYQVWDKLNKVMCEVVAINFVTHQIYCGEPAPGHLHFGNAELREFTGLRDRNGKEVYEGDIVSKIWVNKDEKTIFHVDDGWVKYLWHNFAYAGETWEVIGNIYENPELLEAKK